MRKETKAKIGTIWLMTLLIASMTFGLTASADEEYEPTESGTGTMYLVPSNAEVEVGDNFNVTCWIENSTGSTLPTGYTIRLLTYNETAWLANVSSVWVPSPYGDFSNVDTGDVNNTMQNISYVQVINTGPGVSGNNTAYVINFTTSNCGVLNITIPSTIWSGQVGLEINNVTTTEWSNTTVTITPQDPASLSASTWNMTAINLSWVKGTGDDNVTICRSDVGYDDISGPEDGQI